MRYLYYTLTIVLIFGLGSWLTLVLRPDSTAHPDDLMINQRIITAKEIETRRNNTPYHFSGEDEFLEDMITRELLIQEAQRLEIDREEPFRQSLQNYYEQSLLKILLDRKYQQLSNQVPDESLGRFKENLKSHFTLVISHSPEDPQLPSQVAGNYLELPETLRDAVSDLAIGEKSKPITTGTTSMQVLLKDKRPVSDVKNSDYSEEFIAETALEENKRQLMQKWLTELRNKAQISLPVDTQLAGESK